MTYVLPRVAGDNATGTDRYGADLTDNFEEYVAQTNVTNITLDTTNGEWDVTGANVWDGQIDGADSNNRFLFGRDRVLRFSGTNPNLHITQLANNTHMQWDNCTFIFDTFNTGGGTGNNSTNRTTLGFRDSGTTRALDALPANGPGGQLTANFYNCKFVINAASATYAGNAASDSLFIIGTDFTGSTIVTNSPNIVRSLGVAQIGANIDDFIMDAALAATTSPDIGTGFADRDLTFQFNRIASANNLQLTNFYPYNQRFGNGIVFRGLSQLGPLTPLTQMGAVSGGVNETTLIEANRTIRKNGNVWNNDTSNNSANWRVNEGIEWEPVFQKDASSDPEFRTSGVQLKIIPGYHFNTINNRISLIVATGDNLVTREYVTDSNGVFDGTFNTFTGQTQSGDDTTRNSFDFIIGNARWNVASDTIFADTEVDYLAFSTDVDYRSYEGLVNAKFQIDAGTDYIADDDAPVTNGGIVETIVDVDDGELNFATVALLDAALGTDITAFNPTTIYSITKKEWTNSSYDLTQTFPPQDNITNEVFSALHASDAFINFTFDNTATDKTSYDTPTNTITVALGDNADGIYTVGEDAGGTLGFAVGTLAVAGSDTLRINNCQADFTSSDIHTFDAIQTDSNTNYSIKDSNIAGSVLNFTPTADAFVELNNCSGAVTINNLDGGAIDIFVVLTGDDTPTITSTGNVTVLTSVAVSLSGVSNGDNGRTTVYTAAGGVVTTDTTTQNGFTITSADFADLVVGDAITVVWSGPFNDDIRLTQTLVTGTNNFDVIANALAHPTSGDAAYDPDNFVDTETVYDGTDNDVTVNFQAAVNTPVMGDATTNFFLHTSGLVRGSVGYNLFLFNNADNLDVISSIGVSSGAQIDADFVSITPKNNESYSLGFIENISQMDPQTPISVTRTITAVIDGETSTINFTITIPTSPSDFDLGATVSAVDAAVTGIVDTSDTKTFANQAAIADGFEGTSLGIPTVVTVPNT